MIFDCFNKKNLLIKVQLSCKNSQKIVQIMWLKATLIKIMWKKIFCLFRKYQIMLLPSTYIHIYIFWDQQYQSINIFTHMCTRKACFGLGQITLSSPEISNYFKHIPYFFWNCPDLPHHLIIRNLLYSTSTTIFLKKLPWPPLSYSLYSYIISDVVGVEVMVFLFEETTP